MKKGFQPHLDLTSALLPLFDKYFQNVSHVCTKFLNCLSMKHLIENNHTIFYGVLYLFLMIHELCKTTFYHLVKLSKLYQQKLLENYFYHCIQPI